MLIEEVAEVNKLLSARVKFLEGIIPICSYCKTFVMMRKSGKKLKHIYQSILRHDLVMAFVQDVIRNIMTIDNHSIIQNSAKSILLQSIQPSEQSVFT